LRVAAQLLDLKRLIQLRRNFRPNIAQECLRCILEGGDPELAANCQWQAICQKVMALEETIGQHRLGMNYLGLVSQIQSYEALLRAHTSEKSHQEYVDFFRLVFEENQRERTLGERALGKMQRLQRFIAIQRKFKEFPSPGMSRRAESPFLRAGRDVITNLAQHLPCDPGPKYGKIRYNINFARDIL
jgi:hypothetical protein